MPSVVELSPFVLPCPEDEKRFCDCGDGVLVGDIVKELAGVLKVEPKTLSLAKVHESGMALVLHSKEVPTDKLMVKGVRSLDGVPSRIEVAGKAMPTVLTKAEAMQIQGETMAYYQADLVKLQLKSLQDDCLEEWRYVNRIDPPMMRSYTIGLREILQPQQAKFFPKYGFEATSKGMAVMQSLFNSFQDDPEVQENVNRINSIIGTDYSWLPPDFQARQVFQVVSQPAPEVSEGASEVETQE